MIPLYDGGDVLLFTTPACLIQCGGQAGLSCYN